MPVSNPSMLFTWVAESIALGLIAFAVCEPNYLIYSQLAVASLNGALHAVALMTDWDLHHSISVSYLCIVTSVLVCDCVVPLDSVGPMIRRSFFMICELAALGMTFSSCTGPTQLFFHVRGHFALLLCVGLHRLRCSSGLLGLAVAIPVVAMQCIPAPTVALATSVLAAAALATFGSIEGDWWTVGACAVPLLASAAWLAYTLLKPKKQTPNLGVAENLTMSLMVWPRTRPVVPSKQS